MRPQKLRGGDQREDGRREQRRHLGARQGRDEQPDPGGATDVEQRAGGRGPEIPLHGHVEEGHRERRQQQEVEHPQDHVGELLAQQELQARRRRDVEVDDRAQVLLADHRERRQHGRDQEQQERDHGRHHRRQALDVGVVAVAQLDVGGGDQLALAHAELLALAEPTPGQTSWSQRRCMPCT